MCEMKSFESIQPVKCESHNGLDFQVFHFVSSVFSRGGRSAVGAIYEPTDLSAGFD